MAGCGPAADESAEKVPSYDARTFFETVSVGGASFSHDETRILFSSDASGIFNVYSQPIEGGEAQQLTHSESDAHFAVSWFPGDDRFLYTADQGGNELNHLYVQEAGGEPRDLTPGERSRPSLQAGARTTGISMRPPTSAIPASSTSTATAPRTTSARC